MESCTFFENNMHSAKQTKSWIRDRLARLDRSLDVGLFARPSLLARADEVIE
jgi:hypothetical protein